MRGWEDSFKGIVRSALETGAIQLETELEKASRLMRERNQGPDLRAVGDCDG
jgi:hypothetical protein